MKKFLFFVAILISLQIAVFAGDAVVRAYIFYSSGCGSCVKLVPFITDLEEKYPFKVKYFDTRESSSFEKLTLLEEQLEVTRDGLPKIFLGNSEILVGRNAIKAELEEKIQMLVAEGGTSWPGETKKDGGANLILNRFQSFNQLAVLSAGLIDGINPCAFTTLIFFITFLGFIGKGRKEIFIAGMFFTATVFCTYLLLGLGAFGFMKKLQSFLWLSRNLNYGVAFFALLLGCVNLYDYYKFKIGKASETILQLPMSIKKLIHSVIRVNVTSSGLIIAAVVIGFCITILESVCTGQVYLPTILYVLMSPGMKAQAFFYLVLYNLMFVTPLVLVFGLVFLGVSSDRFGAVVDRNLGVVKVLSSALFFVMALLLVLVI